MIYLYPIQKCVTCGVNFIKVNFLECRVMGFCSDICLRQLPIKIPSKQEYAIKQSIFNKIANENLELDFARCMESK